jgi:hypothetical protein
MVAERLRNPNRAILAALVAVSVGGMADVGEFIATRPGLFSTAPGRAAGSVAGFLVWAALAGTAAARVKGAGGRSRTATLTLAAVAAVGSVGLTAIHLKAGVGGPRTIAGGALGVAALALALASLSGSRR